MTRLKIIGLYLIICFMGCLLCGCSSAGSDPEEVTSPANREDSADQASPYRYTESEEEFQIDLSGDSQDTIEEISYTLLSFSKGNDGLYSPIVKNCKPQVDDSGIVHIPREPEICSLYDPEEEMFVPVTRLEQEGENSWSTVYTRIGIKKDDYVTDIGTILRLTGDASTDQGLRYSLEQRYRAGQDPVRAGYLLANGTQLENSKVQILPKYDTAGFLKPADDWETCVVGSNTVCFSPAQGSKPLFKKIPLSALDLNVAAQLIVKRKDGTTAASDLMILQAGKGEEKAETNVSTDSGTLTFSLQDGKAELIRYEGTDQSLIIPETVSGCPVTSIGEGSFSGEALESIRLPSSIKCVRRYAFHSCEALTELIFPEGLEILETNSISYCEQLKKVHIPASVKKISGCPIVDCKNLTELNISKENSHFRMVDGNLYSGDGKRLIYTPCNLTGTVRIPAGVEEIADYAFAHCGDVSEVIFPEGLKYIGNYSFSETRLTAIALPESLETIADDAFSSYSADNLYESREINYDKNGEATGSISIPEIKIHLGKNVSWIGANTFSACYVSGYSVDPSNRIYSSKKGLLLTKDGSFLLACPTAATGDYSLPEGITNIDSAAFACNDSFTSCLNDFGEPYFDSGITALTLPQSLEFFDSNDLPKTLKTLNIRGDIREWENISKCSSLTIKGLDHVSAFFEDQGIIYSKDKSSLLLYPTGREKTSFTLPEELKQIENTVFYENDSLEKITIPRNACLSDMTDNELVACLTGLSHLKAVEVEEGNARLRSEDGVLFSEDNRTLLLYPQGKEGTAYQIPEGVEQILTAGMSGARLESLSVPASFKQFGTDSDMDSCLSSLYYLTDLKIDEKNPYFLIRDGVVVSKKDAAAIYYLQTENETVQVPEGTRTVSSGAFQLSSPRDDIYPLTFIFPDSLTAIGANNFAGLSSDDPWIKLSVYIPASVKEIDESSFAGSSVIELHVSKNSFAEEFARNHEINYVTDLPR